MLFYMFILTGRDHVACLIEMRISMVIIIMLLSELMYAYPAALLIAQCELCHLHRPSLSLTCMCLVDAFIAYFCDLYHQLLCQRSGWAVSLLLVLSSSVCSCLVGCVTSNRLYAPVSSSSWTHQCPQEQEGPPCSSRASLMTSARPIVITCLLSAKTP